MSQDQDPRAAASEDIFWQESDSQVFLDFGRALTPARDEIARTLVDLVPALPDEAFLFADIGTGQGWSSDLELRHVARAWDAVVKRQSLEYLGDMRAYEFFVRERWNIYDYPDPMDKPSPLFDQLRWLEEAGFRDVGVFWAQAGHAVYGGYKRGDI